MKRWKSWLKLIGITLLAVLLAGLDWQTAGLAFVQLQPWFLAGYGLCFAAMILVRVARLQLALKRLGYTLSFRNTCLTTLEPAFLGVVTPGRLGEFSRIGYIHAHGVPLQKALVLVLLERLIDVTILLSVGLSGLVYIFTPGSFRFLGVLAMLVATVVLFVLSRRLSNLGNLFRAGLGGLARWAPHLANRLQPTLGGAFPEVTAQTATLIYLLGLVSTGLNFLQVFLLAKAFGFMTDYFIVIFSYASATLVSLLPISVGGLGTREATYVLIMARAGISKEQALLFSLMDGLFFGTLLLLILLVPLWISRRITSSLARGGKSQ